MSYSMIFETKIVKLSDGRIIHFDRSGCNNDDSGRRKDDFSGTIYIVHIIFNRYSLPYKKDIISCGLNYENTHGAKLIINLGDWFAK